MSSDIFIFWGCNVAKRSRVWTEEKIDRFKKEGRGMGEGIHYKPWLTIQDVPSVGRSHRIKGIKTGRIHQLLSDLERDFLYLMEWADHVVDIREQFPLERELSLQIAEKKGIRHSIDISTQVPIVMTTDFLITTRINNDLSYIAITIKPSDKLNDSRIIEKFEIERGYWEVKGVQWAIVTEKEIPQKTICRNIEWIHGHYHDDTAYKYSGELLDFINLNRYGTMASILYNFEKKFNLENGEGLLNFKHLLAIKSIEMDMNKIIDIQDDIHSLRINAQRMGKRWAT